MYLRKALDTHFSSVGETTDKMDEKQLIEKIDRHFRKYKILMSLMETFESVFQRIQNL